MNEADVIASGTDWAVLIPATITALSVPILAVITLRNGHTLKEIAPKVTAIDRAVNGQPIGDPPMVDKVTAIGVEQTRVADELRDAGT